MSERKKALFILLNLSFLLFLVLVPSASHAAKVDHHGFTADSENTDLCISCHDGSVGHHISFCTVNCSALTSHALFVPYPPRRNPRRFHSLGEVLARGIRLPDNKVVCVSCHDIANTRPNYLIMDNKGSALCLACHIQ